MTLELRANCNRCEGLCCIVLAFDESAGFGLSKAAGDRCPHLTAGNRCSIHSRLRQRGFSGCAGYDCYGAGQRATELVRGAAWFAGPDERAALFDIFWRLYTIHESLVLLEQAARLDLPPEHEAERARLQSELETLAALGREALSAVEIDRPCRAVRHFLRTLQRVTRLGRGASQLARVLPVQAESR